MSRTRRLVTVTAAAAAVLVMGATPALAYEGDQITGIDRYDTAAKISQQIPNGANTTFLVIGTNFPDAVSASATAERIGGRVLLVEKDRLTSATATELDRLYNIDPVWGGKVVVVGSPATISDAVIEQAKTYIHGRPIERLYGADRYETSRLLATKFTSEYLQAHNPVTSIFFATGTNYPDALSGAAAAGRTNAPVLLVEPGKVPAATLSQIRTGELAKVTTYYVMGSAASVSDGVIAQLQAANPNARIERIGGADRYETSAKAAAKFFPTATSTILATGNNFPDALAASVLSDYREWPLMLTDGNSIPASVKQNMVARNAYNAQHIVFIGGVNASSVR